MLEEMFIYPRNIMDKLTALQRLVQNWSIEVTPSLLQSIRLSDYLPPAKEVYVTFLAGTCFSRTIDACIALKQQGFEPVAHVAPRNVSSEKALREGLETLLKAGINRILLIAGGVSKPLGELDSVLPLLSAPWFEQLPLRACAFAGHPEGSPDIQAQSIAEAERIKQNFAQYHQGEHYFLTQFCFDAAPVITWQEDLYRRGIGLPVDVGIAGLAKSRDLLRHARQCGVGASMNYLLKNRHRLRDLFCLTTPDRVLSDLAAYCASTPNHLFRRLHFYPLGGFVPTVRWLRGIEQGRVRFNHRGGFKVYD